MALERHPVPRWIVVGAGTGGTSATIGRYLQYRCHDTELCAGPDRSRRRSGSVVTLLCDGGERYADTYYSDSWLAAADLDPRPYADLLQRAAEPGEWTG